MRWFVTSAPLLAQVFILQLEGQKRWLLYSPVVPLATEYSVVPRETLGKPTHDILLKVLLSMYLPTATKMFPVKG